MLMFRINFNSPVVVLGRPEESHVPCFCSLKIEKYCPGHKVPVSDSSGRPETKTSKFEFIRDHSSSYFVIPNVNLASNLCKYVNIIRITYVIFPKAWGWFKFIESLQNNWNFFYVVVTYAWPIKSTIQQSDVRTFYAPLKWTFRAH